MLIYVNQGLAISWSVALLCPFPFVVATTEMKLPSQTQFLVSFMNLLLLPQCIFPLCTFCISDYYNFYCVLGRVSVRIQPSVFFYCKLMQYFVWEHM